MTFLTLRRKVQKKLKRLRHQNCSRCGGWCNTVAATDGAIVPVPSMSPRPGREYVYRPVLTEAARAQLIAAVKKTWRGGGVLVPLVVKICHDCRRLDVLPWTGRKRNKAVPV